MRKGFGKQTFKSGDFYEGEWQDDQMQGWGQIKYANDNNENDYYTG